MMAVALTMKHPIKGEQGTVATLAIHFTMKCTYLIICTFVCTLDNFSCKTGHANEAFKYLRMYMYISGMYVYK